MLIRLLARTAAGLGFCAVALSASAAPSYSGMVVFGDSLSDGGNNAVLLTQLLGQLPPVDIANDAIYSRVPSSFGTYSNGMVWTQYLAQSLNLELTPSLQGGSNYAFGGAQTGVDGNDAPPVPGFPFSMRSQVATYLGATAGTADANALFIVAGGGNNIRVALESIAAGADPASTFASTVADYASDMATMVGTLKAAGARHVLVLNTPNFGLTPLAQALGVSAEASALSWAMDTALDGALTGSGASVFDMYGFLTQAVAAGPASGFSNWTNACGAAASGCSVDTSLFWDGIHPTTLAHQQLAAAVYATALPVPEPATTAMLTLGLALVALGVRRRAGLQQR